MATVQDLILVLQAFFPGDLDLTRALYVLAILPTLYPLLHLHRNQFMQPRQRDNTGWMTAIWALIYAAFHPEITDPNRWPGNGPGRRTAEKMYNHIDNIYRCLDIDNNHNNNHPQVPIFPDSRLVLCTQRKNCIICPASTSAKFLRKRGTGWSVKLIGADYKVHDAYLIVAYCRTCGSRYYPDRITYRSELGRLQKFEWECTYLRVSKHGIWVARHLAIAQERPCIACMPAFLTSHIG